MSKRESVGGAVELDDRLPDMEADVPFTQYELDAYAEYIRDAINRLTPADAHGMRRLWATARKGIRPEPGSTLSVPHNDSNQEKA